MEAEETPTAIDVRGLAKRFGAVTALEDVTLRVPRGEIFGFLGPNGAGKTTAVKLLLGLSKPSAGAGTMLGSPLGDRKARRLIGYLPELFRYHDWLSAREVLSLHAKLAGLRPERSGSQIQTALDEVGLTERADDRVGGFSKGMQQRLGLGVALLGDPQLVLLDEPTSALDPIGRHDVRLIVRALKARGCTVFLNSHLLSEVENVCDRVAIVKRGRVIAQGSVTDIVGASRGVRIAAAEGDTPIATILQRFGTLVPEGEATVVLGVANSTVPEIAAALVASNALIYRIEPIAMSLEERFLQMTGDDE
ncbi:MAG: ABC transporter ATP-binding protein [Candidatus Eremiobacteraeota bacterium]|nr:ABC transporter ATP-binding protein [Candidatus Eremiobacteraeota bacterium]